ncbi:MAG: sigma-70 family RNA polymerase sigma factor [Chloroflexi bacterium]|nr:sigma-70 family RNA polymerase sigma factor [Chloroflexota bacterium]
MVELTHLVRAAKQGDGDAYAQIISRFQDMAFAGAYAMLGDPAAAQDAAQDAFIDAYLSLSKLREPAAFPGWFRRIVLKHADRQLRRRRPTVSVETAVPIPSPILDPATAVEQKMRHETVQHAIAQLPKNQRLVITLFYIQGYSQKEVAAFLELPLTTIKKRLYNARQRLKENLTMVQDQLQANKPSQNDRFVDKVQFFIALRAGDTTLLQKMLTKQPDWVDLKTEWPVASDSYYWPLGITPLYYAAGLGDIEMMKLLLATGADVNGAGSNKTPLHHAVILGQETAVSLLLKHGADINAATHVGQTALHVAVIRQNQAIVQFLLQHGAAVSPVDKSGLTPANWAQQKGFADLLELLVAHGAKRPKQGKNGMSVPPATETRQVPVGTAVLGRIIGSDGKPLDGGDVILDQQSLRFSVQQSAPIVFETGIKMIDLMAPIKRGGHFGVFTPLSGIGRLFVQAQIMESMIKKHDGYVVYLSLEHGAATAKSLRTEWRSAFNMSDKILDERLASVFGHVDDTTASKQQVAEIGLSVAEDLRRQGRDVLLIVDSRLTMVDGVVSFLRANTAISADAAITTLYDGDHTAGLEPDIFTALDALITFDHQRGKLGLWPAIDPLRSQSKLLSRPDLMGQPHIDAVTAVRKLFQRYQGLHAGYEYAGFEALFYLNDQEATQTAVIRARRLHRFLTQPLPMSELVTGIPGQLVPLADTLHGVQAILAGKCDTWPEDTFYMIGMLQEAKKRR